jgi:hypothetical protein
LFSSRLWSFGRFSLHGKVWLMRSGKVDMGWDGDEAWIAWRGWIDLSINRVWVSRKKEQDFHFEVKNAPIHPLIFENTHHWKFPSLFPPFLWEFSCLILIY